MRRTVIATAAATVLAGCGASTVRTVTQTNTVIQTQTVTVVRHAAAPPAQTVRAPAPVTPRPSTTATPPGPAGVQSFSGSAGTKSIGTLNVPHDSTLKWTCSGNCIEFAIISGFPSGTGASALVVTGTGNSGNSAVSAGSYPQVQISSTGSWTFSIG